MAKVQHMVVVKFRAPEGESKIKPLFAALAELPRRIPGILHFSGGPYASAEGLNQGFTHGFLMTFTDVRARDMYVMLLEHQRVVGEYLPFIENVLAFDF